MAKASDNVFPYIHLAPGAAPAAPAAGSQRLYIDSADGKPKLKDSAGVVSSLGGGSAFVGARVYNTTAISCANGAAVLLTFDSERYDTDNIHSTATNTGRLTATTAGKYHITGEATFAANATGNRGIVLRINGVTEIAHVRVPAAGGSDVTMLSISSTWDMAATDYVELMAYQTSGGVLSVTNLAAASPEFMMHRLG